MEPWTTDAITINGDLSYALKRGEINNRYVDIEIAAFSDRWSCFDTLIEFREREGAEWRSDMQILYSTANSVDKNRLRNLLCAPKGSLNLIRWDYRRNGLKYGQKPDIRLKILPKYLNFSTSSYAHIFSKNSGINESEFVDSSTRFQPINLNQSGQIIGLKSDKLSIFNSFAEGDIYTYSGLSYPSFAIQILNGNYFIADTGNNEVVEVSEDLSTLIGTISVADPIFLDYLEGSDTLLVTTSGGTIYEYIRGSFILVWTSTTSFGDLKSATYSKKDSNRIITTDQSDNKIRIINKTTGNVEQIHSGFFNDKGDKDSFVQPNMAIEFEDGSITVVERKGRVATFEEFVSSSSSSLDSSSTSSMTSSSLSSSSSSEGFSSNSSNSSSLSSSSSSSSSSLGFSSSSSSSSEGFSSSSSSSSEQFSSSSSSSSSSEQFSSSSSSSEGFSSSSSMSDAGFCEALEKQNPYLEAYWPMEESSGTRLDSIQSHNLSESTSTISSTTGKKGNAAIITAGDGNLVTSGIGGPFTPSSTVAISSWARFHGLTGTVTTVTNIGDLDFGFKATVNPTLNTVSISAITNVNTGTFETSSYTVPLFQFNNIVMVLTSSTLYLFINGQIKESLSATHTSINETNTIFRSPQFDSFGTTAIAAYDEMAVWEDPVFADTNEVVQFAQALYNEGTGAFWDDSIGNWDICEPFMSSSSSSSGEIAIKTIVDSTNFTGLYTSLLVVDGNPAISYYDSTNSSLRYRRADSVDGSTWGGVPTTIDSFGIVGQHTSLLVVDGNPAISYYDTTNGDLKYVRADSVDGSTWGNSPVTVDSTGTVGRYTSLLVIDGNPAISYFDSTNGDLKYVRADSVDGSTWGNSPVTVDSTGAVGQHTSLLVVDGNPAIAYLANVDLKYVRADSVDGSTWGTSPVTVDSTVNVGQIISLEVVNGNPAISYYDSTNSDLKYVRADSVDGSTWGTSPIAVDSTDQVGLYSSLEVVNGKPAISYLNSTNGDLMYARSSDLNGENW